MGARGLAQIMPETGEKIAQVLNDTLYHVDDLFHPIKNIRFGTWYINALRDTLKEILQWDWEEDFIKPLVLASYNGGPHNVRDWVEKGIIKNGKFYPEPDSGSMKNAKLAMAIESIPFFETRDFVKRVLGNEEVYRRLLR